MDKSSPMYNLFPNFNSFLNSWTNASEINNNLLKQILKDNTQNEFGKEYDFKNIKTVKKFQEKVPLNTCEDYSEIIERMTHGEKNIFTSQPLVFTLYLQTL